MQDPTREEMIDFLKQCQTFGDEDDMAFEIEEAIYWFASYYHGGQGSNLYSALSTSEFNPGALARGPADEYLYLCLVGEYANK